MSEVSSSGPDRGFVANEQTTPVVAIESDGTTIAAEALSQKDSERFNQRFAHDSKKPATPISEQKNILNKSENKDGNKPNLKVTNEKDRPDGPVHQEEKKFTSESNKNNDQDKMTSGSEKKDRDYSKMDFRELNELSKKSSDLSERNNARKEVERRVNEFVKVENGEWVDYVAQQYLLLLRNNDWDYIYTGVKKLALEIERDFANSPVGRNRPELHGIITETLNINRAQIIIEGIRNRNQNVPRQQWLKDKRYTQSMINEMNELILPQNAVLDLDLRDPRDLAAQVNAEKIKNEKKVPQQPQITKEDMKDAFERALDKPSKEAAKRSALIDEENMSVLQPITEATPFLIGATPEEIREWKTRALLSAACNRKLMSPNIEALSQNPEAKSITLEQLHLLLSKPGVLPLLSMEAVLIAKNLDPNEFLAEVPGLPKSVFKIYNENQLSAFRTAKIAWLEYNFGITGEDAEAAASISRNLIYLSDTLEDYDSAFDQSGNLVNPNHDYAAAALGKIKSMAVWQAMHLSERLALKAKGGESWSILGNWALRRFRGVKSEPEQKRIMIDIIRREPLPSSLFQSAFELKDASKTRMIDILIQNGNNLINGNGLFYMPELNGPDMKEGPFAYYCVNNLSSAKDILDILNDKGRNVEKDWSKLINAANNLHMNNRDRERILMAIYGVNEKTKRLKPKDIGFGIYKAGATYGNSNFWARETVADKIKQNKLFKFIKRFIG